MHQLYAYRYKSAHDGFTLIEVLVSISIFLLLIGGSAFFIATFLASTDLNETSTQIAQTLRIARERSLAGLNNAQYGVYFNTGTRQYILYRGSSYSTSRDLANAEFDVVTDIGSTLTLTTTFPGDVNFSRLGKATINGRITLAHLVGGNRTIDINEFGIISQGGSGSSGGTLPILVITNLANPFSRYYGEILLTEGMNEFVMQDINDVTDIILATYDIAILGEMTSALTSGQMIMLNTWVTNGGNLIAMRPNLSANPLMATLLGLTTTGTTLSDAYLLVNTASSPGVGIVGQTIQFHSVADRYGLVSGTVSVAELYSSAVLGTGNPAVTLRSVGTQGGEAAAFTYDLAKSVVYTRQGNPLMSAINNDADPQIRMNDLFFRGDLTNWLDTSKAAIPQADEQMRLLANLISRMNSDRKPLPRFWYFPRNEKAVVVMTGDDHQVNGGTQGRFNQHIAWSLNSCNLQNWECIRSTSYIYENNALTNSTLDGYETQGFEPALHVNIGCSFSTAASTWTFASLNTAYTSQLNAWKLKYGSLIPPATVRTHCGPYFDYDTQPQVQQNNSIRLDTNYYFWGPGNNGIPNFGGPGVFTGSGMPMRFTKIDGTIIDVYQAPTQMVDEGGQNYTTSPTTVDTILNNAIGSNGYYGLFVVNAHTDSASGIGGDVSDAVIGSAQARSVPVISSAQALAWIDGRNSSSFSAISWSGTTLAFNAVIDAKANGMNAMVPYNFGINSVSQVQRNGIPVSPLLPIETIKGITYQMFPVSSGSYTVAYADLPPTRFNGQPSGGLSFGTTQITLLLSTSENATCRYSLLPNITYDNMGAGNTFATTGGVAHSQSRQVSSGTTYYIRCKDNTGNPNTDDFKIEFSVNADPFLVAYWRMNEGSGPVTSDSSGNANTGTISNAIWTTGLVGGLSALQFDGVVSFANSASLALQGPMSFFTWARFGSLFGGQWGRYLIGQCSANFLGQFGMTMGRTDIVGALNVGWNGTEIIAPIANDIANTSNTYFVGFTRSGTPGNWTARLYVYGTGLPNNGPRREVLNIPTNPGIQYSLALGRCGNFNTLYFNGVLDEVRLYSRALNDLEIKGLYDAN